jgi:hypothetical protein
MFCKSRIPQIKIWNATTTQLRGKAGATLERERERERERDAEQERKERVTKSDTVGFTVAHSDTIHNDTIHLRIHLRLLLRQIKHTIYFVGTKSLTLYKHCLTAKKCIRLCFSSLLFCLSSSLFLSLYLNVAPDIIPILVVV